MAREAFELESDDGEPEQFRWRCSCGDVGDTWTTQDQAAFRGASHVEGHRSS